MVIDTRTFSIGQIRNLIDNEDIVDNSVITPNNTVDRYNVGITQPMIYAIQHHNHIEVLNNNVIKPLIDFLNSDILKEQSPLKQRRLYRHDVQICILWVNSTDEERESFRKLIL